MEEPFLPKWWAKNADLQTLFGSARLRILGKCRMTKAATEAIVPAGDGVRLLGYHSRQTVRPVKGLVILLHGWEGSSDSTYVVSTGHSLYRRGYDIFRLNLRDHGHSHHLNRGLFHGALLDETLRAVAHACGLLPDGPCYLIGFSLGGNFALRIALRQSLTPIANLCKVFCISPALDPYRSTLAIDVGKAVYRRYFLSKWKRSLRTKQRCFPELYRFDEILRRNTCLGLTEAIMPYFPDYPSYMDYFRQYTLTGQALAPLRFPVQVFAAQDDPVVSVEDFLALPSVPDLAVSIQRYGGHCGFLDPFPWGCWYERRISALLDQGN